VEVYEKIKQNDKLGSLCDFWNWCRYTLFKLLILMKNNLNSLCGNNNMNVQCKKVIISGVVQGVGFRYHTSHQGMKLGLTGYAKNLENGDVEVAVCGLSQQIVEMEKWLQVGPKTSLVESVKSELVSYEPIAGFKIL